MLLIEAALQ